MSEFKQGIYPDVPELDYHAGTFGPEDSLSSTEAKRILAAPAVLKWYRDNPQPAKAAYDFGHIVHGLVLGTGLEIAEIPEELLSINGAATTKEAKAFVAEARLAGAVPMKKKDLEAPTALADAVLTDPVAGPLFQNGTPEQSIYAKDTATGVWMRGRIDWTTDWTENDEGATVLVDLKTTAGNASLSEFSREAARFDYGVQREFYRQIWMQITGEPEPRFIHVVVSKQPPYLVNVFEFDFEFEMIGQEKVRQALETYAECMATGIWPGYAPTIKALSPPAYYVQQDEEEMQL